MNATGITPRANNFNLIRLILASMVLLAHASELVDGDNHRELATMIWRSSMSLGGLAVSGFFMISGYLIAQSWVREPQLGPYLMKRAWRIYPGFLGATLLCCLCVAPLGTNPYYWRDFQVGPFLAGMFTLQLPKVPDPFLGLPFRDINGAMWTISYEFTCYLGLAALGLAGLLKRRYLVLGLTMVLIALDLAEARGLIHPAKVIGDFAFKLIPMASYFLAGTTFFLYRDRVRFTRVGLIVSAAVLFVAMFRYASTSILLPWLGAYLLLGVGFAPPLPGTALVRRLDVSYGTYLYGWPIQEMIILHWRDINPWLLFAITLPLSLGMGWLSWRLIEEPAMKWRGGRPALVHDPAAAISQPG